MAAPGDPTYRREVVPGIPRARLARLARFVRGARGRGTARGSLHGVASPIAARPPPLHRLLHMVVLSRLTAAIGAAALVVVGSVVAQGTGADPAQVVREAELAVRRDGAPALRQRLTSQLGDAGARPAALLGLATLARLVYDYPAAERHYQTLLAERRGAADRWTAHAHLGRANADYARARFAPAETAFVAARAAADPAGDDLVAAEAMVAIAGRRPEPVALAMLDTARRLAGDALALQAWIHCRRAGLARTASWEERFAMSDSGVALAARADAPAVAGQCALGRSILHGSRGDTDPPIRWSRQADSLFLVARDVAGRAQTLSRLGYRYIVSGDYGEARAALQASIPLAQQSALLRYEGSSHIGLAGVSLRINDYAGAAEQLRLAYEVAERAGDPTVTDLADTYRADLAIGTRDFATARQLLEKKLQGLEGSTDHYTLFIIHRNYAQLGMRMRDWALAERELRRAREAAETGALTGPLEELSDHEGRYALLRGDFAAAKRHYAHSLTTLDSSDHSLRYGIRARLAQAHAGTGDLRRAEQELTAASEELDAWRAGLQDDELRLLASDLCGCADQDLGIPSTLNALARGGRAEAAYALAERRRARELASRMMQAEVLRDERSAPGTLRERVARQLPSAPTAAEIRAALPDEHTALLEYVTGPDLAPTTLFVLTRGGLRAFTLAPLDSLGAQVTRFTTLLEEGDDPTALASALGAALLDSAAAALPASVTRLVVVPDGILHRLPFDALRLADGRYVLERWATSIAPSAAVARALWSRDATRGGRADDASGSEPARVLALGDPAFVGERDGDASRGEALRSLFDSAGGLTRLTGSGREARLVASYAPESDVRVRDEASEAFLKRAPLAGFDVLHLATHALVDDRTAARTALALAPGGGEDGFLSPGDVAALRLDADLVVLSACRTAGGVLLGGEGVWGLTGPLLQAGARSVVATGWRIGDESAVQLVDDLYAGLARGLAVSEALREAKLAALRRGAPPREWAAFTVVGDPLVTVPLREPAPWTRVPVWVVLLGGAALAGGAAAAYSRTRRGRTAVPR